MSYSTTLNNEVGIVISSQTDNESTEYVDSVSVIVGQFRRGRTDKPMRITQNNVRAALGHDPRNPDYAAVLDALATGIDHVMVMRVVLTSTVVESSVLWNQFNWNTANWSGQNLSAQWNQFYWNNGRNWS